MRSFRDRNPYAIGIASVLVIGLFVGFAFMVGVLHLLEDAYKVEAVFSDAAGIRGGDEVKVAGVKAGRVTKIKADRGQGAVIVEMVVNRGVDLGPETRAEIALETLLGTKFVRLSGPVHRPHLEDMEEEERVIPLDRTSTPVDLFALATLGTRRIQETDTDKLKTFIDQLAEVTAGDPEDIKTLLRSVSEVSSAINSREGQLRKLLEEFDGLSALLAEKDQTLVSLIDQSQAVLDVVARREQELRLGLRGGDRLATELSHLIGVNKTRLDTILSTLHPTLEVVDRHLDDVNRGLSVVGPGSLGLARATTHGPWNEIYVRAVGPDFLAVIQDFAAAEAGGQ